MRALFELILILSLCLGGGSYLAHKVLVKVRKAALTKIAKGLPSLQKFNAKLTGYKSSF